MAFHDLPLSERAARIAAITQTSAVLQHAITLGNGEVIEGWYVRHDEETVVLCTNPEGVTRELSLAAIEHYCVKLVPPPKMAV